ncbi:MAG: cysteine desulfurase, partial [Thermoprotei archaeon]
MLNPYEIRKDFPIFERRIRGRPLVYLDSTATSQRPRQVIEAVNEFYRKYNANVHRGLHELSQEASEAYERAHEVIAKFINAYSWEEVVFVRNATEALNLVAYAWGMKNLEEGDEVVTTIMEHHSNLLPWWFICRLKKCKLKLVKLTNDYRLNYKELEESITERTKVVAVTHMSNV